NLTTSIIPLLNMVIPLPKNTPTITDGTLSKYKQAPKVMTIKPIANKSIVNEVYLVLTKIIINIAILLSKYIYI
ncbi:hypothetical protein, partial [Acidianus sp. RZ1]|uniref:hypothetical protein n=1 Tax=Acidianus sp. RZ1 TaxID=1540082 RepID=UPI0014920A56